MVRKCSIAFLLIFFNFLSAQEVKFGKVTKEELMEEVCPIDASASAMVLYKYRNTYYKYGRQLVTEVYQKIKVYHKNGFDKATKQLVLYESKSKREVLSKFSAFTYNLEGGEIVKTKLEKDQIFENELVRNYKSIRFTMPNLKEGSIVEFRYRITSPFYQDVDEYEFQSNIPIKRIEAHLKMPEKYVFKSIQKGYINFESEKSSYSDAQMKQSMIKESYYLYDIPALKAELYVDNIDNYRAGVYYELISIRQSSGLNRVYAQSWDDVVKYIKESSDYKKELDITKPFKRQIDALLNKENNNEKKLKLIYEYVKDNINWNGRDGKYFQYGIEKSLEEKKGNAADINLMLVAMLRYANIEANPVIISTKDNGIPLFPTHDKLNYVIVLARVNEKKYFLDATQEFSDINLLPLRDYNWQGILIDSTKSNIKKIDLIKPQEAVAQFKINSKIAISGEANGTFNAILSGHHAYQFRESAKNRDIDELANVRERNLDGFEVIDYKIENVNVSAGKASESFIFYQEKAAEVLNDRLYLKPIMLSQFKTNPFKLEERKYPIDFGFPFKNMYLVNIEIPEGYTPESTLKPFMIRTPDGSAEFKYNINFRNNTLSLSIILNIKQARYGAESYLIFKEFFKQMINKQAEQIVLKKI